MEATVVRAGDLVLVGGLGCAADELFERLETALAGEGAAAADVVELTTFHVDVREMDAAFDTGRRALSAPYPAWTPAGMVAAPGGERVLARAIAHAGAGERRGVVPDTIAWWRGYPWSAGCRKGGLLAVAGQYGTDTDGDVVTPGYHDGQARNALNRLKEVCGMLGSGLDELRSLWSFHQDPRGIEPCAAVFEHEFFPSAGPPWTAAGAPGLYRFGMLCQFRALGGQGIEALAAETGADPRPVLERVAALPGQALDILSLHRDVRDAEAVRALGRDVLGNRPVTWTAAGMTGFRSEGSVHAIHALAIGS
jgi:enamine deaminase RidA (YjgF/YER057c/UK114 family)